MEAAQLLVSNYTKMDKELKTMQEKEAAYRLMIVTLKEKINELETERENPIKDNTAEVEIKKVIPDLEAEKGLKAAKSTDTLNESERVQALETEKAKMIHVGNLLTNEINGMIENLNTYEAEVQTASKNPLQLAIKRDYFRVAKSNWLSNSAASGCMDGSCSMEFNLFNRKHHCRKCGKIFCSNHVKKAKITLLEKRSDPAGHPAKLCNVCVSTVNGRHLVFKSFEEAVQGTGDIINSPRESE